MTDYSQTFFKLFARTSRKYSNKFSSSVAVLWPTFANLPLKVVNEQKNELEDKSRRKPLSSHDIVPLITRGNGKPPFCKQNANSIWRITRRFFSLKFNNAGWWCVETLQTLQNYTTEFNTDLPLDLPSCPVTSRITSNTGFLVWFAKIRKIISKQETGNAKGTWRVQLV